MSIPGGGMRAGSNIRTAGGASAFVLQPRIWQRSRAALSYEFYTALQVGLFAMEYAERFAGFQLDPESQEELSRLTTLIWGGMGVMATVAGAITGVVTGQVWYTVLSLAAIPLQLDTIFKSLTALDRSKRLRKYFENREEIISTGLH